jgi:hypothetical protein
MHIKETGTQTKEWEKVPNKKGQKGFDTRWTNKNNYTFYGYENNVKSDVKTKPIETFEITNA